MDSNNAVSTGDHQKQQQEAEETIERGPLPGPRSTAEPEGFTIVSQSHFNDMMEPGDDNSWDTGFFEFDKTIGALEDIIMSPEFQSLYTSQLEKHWAEFSPDYENPIDFQIFKEYSQAMAHFIENQLKKAIPQFDMEKFVYALQHRGVGEDGEIFEMLSTLTDFNKFHELIEDYRNMKEGKSIDLTPGITIKQIK